LKQIDSSIEIIAGGHFASLNKEYIMSKCSWLDAIIVGEGELSLYEYTTKYTTENTIKGVYNRHSKFIPRERIVDLDTLPFQTRYLTLNELNGQPFSLYTSRGCYGECSFCSISSFYQTNTKEIKQTFRSADSVANEINSIYNNYGCKVIKIIDDNFFRCRSNEFIIDLIRSIKDLPISFRLFARPNDITEERGKLLKQLNVKVLAIGVESTHEESLKLFNKGIDLNDSIKAINILKSNEITCLANFIMFTPIIDIINLKKTLNLYVKIIVIVCFIVLIRICGLEQLIQ
jgi:radical SAM superfamily enzyme YgiQ (UPF0313 family)